MLHSAAPLAESCGVIVHPCTTAPRPPPLGETGVVFVAPHMKWADPHCPVEMGPK